MDTMRFFNEDGACYRSSNIFNGKKDNNPYSIWNLWLISDTHFNHYPKTWEWNRIDNWEEIIKQRWNRMVGEDEFVLHLGDFHFGNKEMVYDTVKELNGKIFLLKGNHDRHSKGWYDDCRITLIKKPFIVDCNDITFLFSHKKQCNLPGSNTVNIHGHSHEKKWFITNEGSGLVKGTTYINISVEKIDYRPIRLNALMYRAEDVHFSRLVI